jgi:hypothetical protein
MDPDDRAHLLQDWWEHSRLSCGSREERKALSVGRPHGPAVADEALSDLVSTGSPDVILLLADLVDAGPSRSSAVIVGTGPLEDLVHEHGDALIDELETLARRRPTFRAALSSVAIDDGAIAEGTASRIRSLLSKGTD